MTENYDEMIEELQQDLRQERLTRLWNQYGKKITSAAIFLIAMVGIYSFWQQHELKKRTEHSEFLSSAQELILRGKKDEALETLEFVAQHGPSTYAVQSKLLIADLLRDSSEPEKIKRARSIYEEISHHSKANSLFREFAQLMAVSMDMSQESNADDLLTRLTPLAGEKSPWRLQAMELQAVIYANKGDHAKSTEIFATIARESHGSAGLQKRAQIMTQMLLNTKGSDHA